jgi:hypothetical protein
MLLKILLIEELTTIVMIVVGIGKKQVRTEFLSVLNHTSLIYETAC